MYRLLCGVDEEEPSAVMEVKPDEVKSWLVVVTWLLLRELSAPKVTLLHTRLLSSSPTKKNFFFWKPGSGSASREAVVHASIYYIIRRLPGLAYYTLVTQNWPNWLLTTAPLLPGSQIKKPIFFFWKPGSGGADYRTPATWLSLLHTYLLPGSDQPGLNTTCLLSGSQKIFSQVTKPGSGQKIFSQVTKPGSGRAIDWAG